MRYLVIVMVSLIVAYIVNVNNQYTQCRSIQNTVWISRSHTCLILYNGILMTVKEKKTIENAMVNKSL